MAWENLKRGLLEEVLQRVDRRGDPAQCDSLHHLADAFYARFPPEDLRGRSAENLYGCLYGLLHFMQSWPEPVPKVRILNPEMGAHGWESKATVIAILCPELPFCTASVRGEINARDIVIHTLASCNLMTRRNADGSLIEVLAGDEHTGDDISRESLLYFEITRHSNLSELEDLRSTIEDILANVERIVTDFDAMQSRVDEAIGDIRRNEFAPEGFRSEAIAFLEWLKRDHMTFLGYEFLRVRHETAGPEVDVDTDSRLGVLRVRDNRGREQLSQDLAGMTVDELRKRQLSFSKSRLRSRIHRRAYPDYIEVKVYDDGGRVVAQHRFLGLYTATVYTMDPVLIPILRRKVEQVVEISGLDRREHDGRELVRVLELFPRDELFQSSVQTLFETVSAVTRIQERRQTRLFVREDVYGKFVSCLVYMPRVRYTTRQREKIQAILERTFHAEESDFTTQFTESILVRVHFVLRVDPNRSQSYDVNEIEEQIVQATLAWEDRLRLRLVEEFGEEEGEQCMRELGAGFSPGYQDDFDPRVAVMDIRHLRALSDARPIGMDLYRRLEEHDDHLKLRLYRREEPLPLSDVLPILENLGLRVVTERSYRVRSNAGDVRWVQEFSLIYALADDIHLDEVKDEFEDAFARIWFGEAESDPFNRLLLGSRLSWREIALLRAYTCYLRQINFPYSRDYIAETMADHLHLCAGIVELFLTRFSPVFDGDEDWRAQRELAVEERILNGLETVENLGQDRIIRYFVTLVKATLRTNFFQEDDHGDFKSHFSFKLAPRRIPDIPRPAPLFEIYVYSPRVEGVHLRGGKVARGGLRWSDRLEDFRTEVLGLVKAQQVKNAVIVPVGAKGGFVAKRLQADMSRDEMQAEGVACYQTFIRGLLDITDNRVGDAIVRPPRVISKDDDDPYLVVAADKGTASFSDIANSISADYGFWLGDAFASGGSVGYDHKKMGITARGAWVSVARHFREMGVDVDQTDFTVVGVGDMSGDVFGNGMLLSRHIRLVAAFNHQHIFIDPDPDAEKSYLERERLFALPRSGWTDYDTSLISSGGGIFSRAAKSIAVTPEMRRRFDIGVDQLTPTELIVHLLKAEVDLLWNGGIGTYVKASSETHTDVGDKTNDALRVNAKDLRCRVVGEGGNLGLTQLARVEYGLHGGRSNTDFIDNAGGVDCSDHEVNIKILLDAIVDRGDLTEKQRNQLLQEMTESVASLVLHNNYRQTEAISLTAYDALTRSDEYRRLIGSLENAGRLDRALEFLPSDDEIAERRGRGVGLTRPELSVLLSYAKAILKEDLLASDLGADPRLAEAVRTAFPEQLVSAFPVDVARHRLHREILCTQVANDLVNRMGPSFVERQRRATGAAIADIARAYTSVLQMFEIEPAWQAIEDLDGQLEAEVQLEMMLSLVRLIKRAVRWLLRNRRHQSAPSKTIAEFGEGVAAMRRALPDLMRGTTAEQFASQRQRYVDAGVGELLAGQVAATPHAYMGLGIIDAASDSDRPLMDIADLYFELGEKLQIDWFSQLILGTSVDNEWQALARESYLEDLQRQQCAITIGVVSLWEEGALMKEAVALWEHEQAALIARWRDMLSELQSATSPDFAMFAVANRELLDLAQSSQRLG